MWRDLRNVISARSAVETTASIIVGIAVFEVVHAFVMAFVITPLSFSDSREGVGAPPLTFDIGGTYFYYADLLGYAITLGLLALLLAGIVRIVRPRLWDELVVRDCPLCLSEIPVAASVCGACGRDVS